MKSNTRKAMKTGLQMLFLGWNKEVLNLTVVSSLTQIPLWMQRVQSSYEGNTLFQTIIQAKAVDAMPFPDYEYESGLLKKGGLPNSKGEDSILVVVDRLTKYSHFIALKHPYTAISVAKMFFDNIYKLHGLSEQSGGSSSTDSVVPFFQDQATWEDYHAIAARLPGFDPWGQGSKKGTRNVAFNNQNATFTVDYSIIGTHLDFAIEGETEFGGGLKIRAQNGVVSGALWHN
ncbi:UNVERIFIED_CONTAM: hypothetical protein Sangu_0198300 [Sesamum angustifolium]|uniref:Reverse transcriptase n=1 Tax=Sesamum angustifolium TaxID=2727405 RepID=A0AAW2RMR2_9LAMI